MTLKEQLTEAMKQAMRARDMDRLGTIRFLLSDIKNTEIDEGELDDSGVQKVIARQVKQMNDAISEYEKGGRQDLAEQEQAKVAVLEEFLPAQLSDEELQAIVERVAADAGTDNMGQLIGLVMKEVEGQADGKRVSMAVKTHLSD